MGFGAFVIRSLCLVFIVFSPTALSLKGMNLEICEEETENHGLIPPGVPESFEIWVSVSDNSSTRWVRELYDGVGMRGKVESVSEGESTHYIYDYQKNMVVLYKSFHPEARNPLQDPLSKISCFAQEIKNVDKEKLPFGMRFGTYYQDVIRIFDPYQVMQFGGEYKFAFVASHILPDRGIPVNTFHGCVYNKFEDSTYRVNFSWAQDIVVTESAYQANIDSFPIRKVIKGGYYASTPDNPDKSVWVPREEIHDIIFFDDSPYVGDEIFQVPTRLSCKYYHSPKEFPTLPTAFSFDMEETGLTRDKNGKLLASIQRLYYQVWYDFGLKIGRFDYKPSMKDLIVLDLLDHFPDGNPVSTIYDFNTGIAYYMHKSTGQCFPRAIPEDDSFFLSKKRSKSGELEMASPYELFNLDESRDNMEENFQYKGKYASRDIECDVWSRTYRTEDGRTATKEVYFATDSFHSEEGDEEESYRVPVRDTEVFYTVKDSSINETVVEINYFRVRGGTPDLSAFDLNSCLYMQIKTKKFSLAFDGSDTRFSRKHMDKFLRNFRLILVEQTRIGSSLRIQQLEHEYSEATKTVTVTFLLTDVPDVGKKDKGPEVVTLEEAVKNLNDTIKSPKNILAVEIIEDSWENPILVVAKPDTFRELPFE